VIDENRIREAIRWVLRQEAVEQDKRLRLTLDLSQEPGSVYLSVEKLHIPPLLAYEKGVSVVTCDLHRVQPLAKLTDFIAPASDYRQALAVGINEALMVNSKGEILEGLSSNFFAIRASKLITAGEEVLAGITRALVIDAARQLNLPIEYRAVQLSEIPQIDEAFITSASRGILPVCSIDNSVIGNGQPGEITKTLSAAFDRLIADEQELI
jgi:branched-chain amino acid aminotransferase